MRVRNANAPERPDAARMVMGLLQAGIPVTLLVDLYLQPRPDPVGIYRAERAANPVDVVYEV